MFCGRTGHQLEEQCPGGFLDSAAHVFKFSDETLAELRASLENAPSGLPQESIPGMSEAEYREFQQRIKASQAQEDADDEHDADLVWLLHVVRDFARAKKTRKSDPAQFTKAAQRLSFECGRYVRKHY